MSAELMRLLRKEMPLNIQAVDLSKVDLPALVTIDVVNGFCAPGAGNLAPRSADPAIDRMVVEVNWLAQKFAREELPIWAFRDEHDPNIPEPPYPPHCIKGSGEELLVLALRWLHGYRYGRVAPKRCINGFVGAIDPESGENAFAEWVNEEQITHLVFVGICTDICVADIVCATLSARNHKLMPWLKEVIVYTPGVATYNLSLEDALQAGLPPHAAHPADVTDYKGLYIMASRGAILADKITLG